MGVSHPPRLANSQRPPGHGHRSKGRQPTVITVVTEQKLPTPERSVIAVTETIERQPHYRIRVELDTVLGEARGEMRVMVLNSEQPTAFIRSSLPVKLARQVVRVRVDREDPRLMAEQFQVQLERLPVCNVGGRVLQIAEML